MMKRVVCLALVLVALACTPALGQTRKGSSAQRGQAAAKAKASQRKAAERISAQITTLSQYLYVYGSVVKGIQTSEQTLEGGKIPPATQALIDKNKAGVVESIRKLGDEMRRLEMDLGEDPDVKAYFQQINKLSEDVDLAADAAAAGKYDDSAKKLVSVVGVLAQALLPPAN